MANPFSSAWQFLFGSGQPAQTPVDPAPPLVDYPSHGDADFARRQDFGYGSGNEPYLEGKQVNSFMAGRMSGPEVGSISDVMDNLPALSKNVPTSILPEEHQRALDNAFMRAALASQRNPIGMLGFDPAMDTVDTKAGNVSPSGIHEPSTQRTWVTVPRGDDPSSIMHESVHRGFARLLKESPQAKALMAKVPVPEEILVRLMMKRLAGDPEKDSIPKRYEDAVKRLEKDPKAMALVEGLQEIAQKMIARRKPGGPR